MKTFLYALTAAVVLAPTVASATYMCDKMFAEKYGQSCPAGSVWDKSQHACMVTG